MKLYTTLLLLAAGCSVALADTVSEEQAMANAVKFMQQNGTLPVASRAGKPMLKKALQSRGFYAFNIDDEEGGYVISSTSDKTQAVLGYSDQGTIDADNMPDPLKFWLESIDNAVENIEAGVPQEKQLTANEVAHVADKQAIEPLVKCQWNQGDPFNLLTPSYVENGVTHAHSATGCVATATTQIMYYWKWPQEACKTIPSYTYNWSGQVRTTAELEPIVFNWSAMTDTYNNNSSYESKIAVSELMLYAGHGMKSGYAGATGATSGNALSALQNYFGYSKDAFNVYHLNYTFQEWEDLYYNELAAGRPILMGADNYERTGGHEFICDGYDGNGLYHINWGWGGWDDGYFVLTVMAPDSQGIGGSTDANGYSMGQNACINLRPEYNTPDEEIVHAAISAVSAGQSKLVKDSDGNFSLYVTAKLHSLLLHQYILDHAYRLLSEDGEVVSDALGVVNNITMHPANAYNMNVSVKMSNLNDGTYKLRGISRRTTTDEWYYDDNSDRNYLELVVEGNTMSVTAMPGQGTKKLVVNSITLEGTTTAGQWQKVVYNITNKGNDFYGETYLFIDGERSSGNTISINAGETVDIYYKIKPKSSFGFHNFTLSYSTSTSSSNVIHKTDRLYKNDCQWNADGTISALPKVTSGVSYEVPNDAVALYLTGSSPRSIGLTKANPNLVLYYDDDVVLNSRSETILRKYTSNIVLGNTAKAAAFKDGYSAAIPIPFVAEKVSYTRENVARWTTVALPFDVDEITVDGEPVDWFKATTDTDKYLFVKSVAGNRGSQLRFSHSQSMKANTGYFIGVKGNLNGSDFDHTGKSVTFTGHDVNVAITGENTEYYVANAVKLVPCYKEKSAGKLLAIDEACENFVQTDKVKPFHAYLNPTGTTTSYEIYYDEGESAGIEEVTVADDDTISPDAPVYNILGVKVGIYADFDQLNRGLYIVTGHKIVKR